MNINQYIFNARHTYKFRIKTIFPIDDAILGKIERFIMRYDPINMTKPIKTIIQRNPLDFPNIQDAEVYIIDIETSLPVSYETIQKELTNHLRVPERYIVVKSNNDPLQTETNKLNAFNSMDSDAAKNGYSRGALLNDPYYQADQQNIELYGDSFTQKFLYHVNKIEKEQEEKRKIDASFSLFKWADKQSMQHSDANEFNKNIDGAPLSGGKSGNINNDTSMSAHGNLDDENKIYHRIFKDKNGKTIFKSEKK